MKIFGMIIIPIFIMMMAALTGVYMVIIKGGISSTYPIWMAWWGAVDSVLCVVGGVYLLNKVQEI